MLPHPLPPIMGVIIESTDTNDGRLFLHSLTLMLGVTITATNAGVTVLQFPPYASLYTEKKNAAEPKFLAVEVP